MYCKVLEYNKQLNAGLGDKPSQERRGGKKTAAVNDTIIKLLTS